MKNFGKFTMVIFTTVNNCKSMSLNNDNLHENWIYKI